MKVLLDINLPPRLRDVFIASGHQCLHWSQVGDPRADDHTIMTWAEENGWVVVTHDLDFSAILAATKASSPSVIQIRTQDVLAPSFQSMLLQVLQEFKTNLEQGALIVVDAKRARARILPLKD